MTTAIPPTLRPTRRRGGIVVWEGQRPSDEPLDEPARDDAADAPFWQKLGDSLAAIHLDFSPVTGQICDCGCLVRPDEFCPACLLWCERNADEHAQRRPVIYYRPINRESEAA